MRGSMAAGPTGRPAPTTRTTNLTIWGTGQPVPMFDPEYRPGDNLFTNSTVGFDVNTGKMKWYFQYTPGDFLDYDEVGIQQLVDTKINGEDRKIRRALQPQRLLLHAGPYQWSVICSRSNMPEGQLDGRHRSEDRQAGRV